MGAFTLAFWYKENEDDFTSTEPKSIQVGGLLPHPLGDTQSNVEQKTKPIALLIFTNKPERLVLHLFYFGEFSTRMITIVAFAAASGGGLTFLYILGSLFLALLSLATARLFFRQTSLEALIDSILKKKVRWLLQVRTRRLLSVFFPNPPL